jgi:hypothetical protein
LGCGDNSGTILRHDDEHGVFYGDFVLVDTDFSTSGSISISFTSTPPT